MDLALNNLQRLICHKTKQTKPNRNFTIKCSLVLYPGTPFCEVGGLIPLQSIQSMYPMTSQLSAKMSKYIASHLT